MLLLTNHKLFYNLNIVLSFHPNFHFYTQLNSKSLYSLNSVGAKLRYMGYFASLLHPQEEKFGYYFQSGKCLGALETHVLLSFCGQLSVNGL